MYIVLGIVDRGSRADIDMYIGLEVVTFRNARGRSNRYVIDDLNIQPEKGDPDRKYRTTADVQRSCLILFESIVGSTYTSVPLASPARHAEKHVLSGL